MPTFRLVVVVLFPKIPVVILAHAPWRLVGSTSSQQIASPSDNIILAVNNCYTIHLVISSVGTLQCFLFMLTHPPFSSSAPHFVLYVLDGEDEVHSSVVLEIYHTIPFSLH